MATEEENQIKKTEAESKAFKTLCAFLLAQVARRADSPANELEKMISDLERLTKDPPGPDKAAFTKAIQQVVTMAKTTLPED